MMPADALASIDIAWIFSAIFLRSRSTLDRLPSASDRLPPDFCWMLTTMPKKFASGTGIRSNSRPHASPSGMPIAWVSMIARNSLRSGSGESAATTLIESNSRKPLFLVVIACALPEARPADPGGAVPADDLAVGVLSEHVVEENVLGDDGVALHTHH